MILLVHGLLGHMRGAEMEGAIGGPFLSPDLLGYGEYSEFRGEISLDAQVAHLEVLLQRNGVRSAHVVGHSIGGAIAVLFARKNPNAVRSIVNVEGNFTLKDAFWSQGLARMPVSHVQQVLDNGRADPAAWLAASGVRATPERIAAALSHLRNQQGPAVRAMAGSVVEVTSSPDYLREVRTLLESGIPMHLVAGERSRSAWDVPQFVERLAQSSTVVQNTGHLVTIESPLEFGAIVKRLVN